MDQPRKPVNDELEIILKMPDGRSISGQVNLNTLRPFSTPDRAWNGAREVAKVAEEMALNLFFDRPED